MFYSSDSLWRYYNWKFSEHEEANVWEISVSMSVMAEGSSSLLARVAGLLVFIL